MHSEKLQILEEILGSFYCSNEEYLFSCPFCKHHKKKLSINIVKNTYKCWVCDSSGRNVYWLVKRYGNHKQKAHWNSFNESVDISDFDNIFEEEQIEEEKQRIKLPSEYICLANRPWPRDSKLALDYLRKRDVSETDILKWKIGYCSEGQYKNRIIIPSFNDDGYCDYFIARTYKDDWMKYKNPPASRNIVFNELMVDWTAPVVLVEGAFDAINAENSIPLLGSTLNKRSKLFRAILTHSKQIYIALDKDAEKKALNIIKTLISHGIEVHKIDTSGYEDVGEMTKEEFAKRKQSATLLDEATILMQKILQI